MVLTVLLALICAATAGPCLGASLPERSGGTDGTAWLRAELAVFGSEIERAHV